MGPVEAAILVIVAAPALGCILFIVVETLPGSGPALTGRSRCSSCNHPRRPWDLLASVGLWYRRGRCPSCGAFGAVNAAALGTAAFGIALWAVLSGAPAWPSAALGWTLLALSVIDWRHLLLPDVLTLPLLAGGLVLGAILGSAPDHLAGAAAGAGFLLLIGWGFRRISGREGLGMGDAKLFAAGGAWTGWQALPGVLVVAALLGLAYAVLDGRIGEGQDRPVPFGPFLAIGIWVSWLYGPVLL